MGSDKVWSNERDRLPHIVIDLVLKDPPTAKKAQEQFQEIADQVRLAAQKATAYGFDGTAEALESLAQDLEKPIGTVPFRPLGLPEETI